MYALSGINNTETLSQFSLQFLPLAFILKFHSSLSLLPGLLLRAQGSQVKHFYLLLVWFGSTFSFLSPNFLWVFCFPVTSGGMGAARKEWHLYHVWDAFRCKSISGSVRLLANSFPIKSSQSGLPVSTTGCSLDLKNICMEWRVPKAEEIWEFWIELLRLLLDNVLFGSFEVPVKYLDFAVWKPQEQ